MKVKKILIDKATGFNEDGSITANRNGCIYTKSFFDKLTTKSSMVILDEFQSNKIVGQANNVVIEDSSVFVDAEFDRGVDPVGMYLAPCYSMDGNDVRKKYGVTTITKAKLLCIALVKEHVDENIPRIKETDLI